MTSNPQDRVEITRLIETWDKAFRVKDVAGYAFGLVRYKMGIQGLPEPYDATVRQTFGLRKTGQRWKVIHYHESVQTLETPPHFGLERDD